MSRNRQLLQEERGRRQWPVGRLKEYLETDDNRVTGWSDVEDKRRLKGDSRAYLAFCIEEENHRKRTMVEPEPNTTNRKYIICPI